MPEGPEIKLAADEVAAAISGRETTEVCFAFNHLKAYEPQLTGQIVKTVEARGKAILTRFANGLNIYSHNQLYGKWVIRSAKDYPNTNRQLRLAIHNSDRSALLYSASDIEVLRDEELADHDFLSSLGPDLLAEDVTLEQVRARFQDETFRRRRLTTLLLDQRFLAGPGNYLRSEILFAARVHPSLRPVDCSAGQIERLTKAAIHLTRQSYETKGITNDLALVEMLQKQGYSRQDYRFRVFNRAGQPCFVCGAPIIKKQFGGRRCYFCPMCQQK